MPLSDASILRPLFIKTDEPFSICVSRWYWAQRVSLRHLDQMELLTRERLKGGLLGVSLMQLSARGEKGSVVVCLSSLCNIFVFPPSENLTETEMTNRGCAINWCSAGAPSSGLKIPLDQRTLPTLQLLKSTFLHCFDKFFWVNLLTLSHSAFQCLQPFQVFLSVSLRLKRPHTSKRTQLRWNLIQ